MVAAAFLTPFVFGYKRPLTTIDPPGSTDTHAFGINNRVDAGKEVQFVSTNPRGGDWMINEEAARLRNR